jgi:hypothetical protein
MFLIAMFVSFFGVNETTGCTASRICQPKPVDSGLGQYSSNKRAFNPSRPLEEPRHGFVRCAAHLSLLDTGLRRYDG